MKTPLSLSQFLANYFEAHHCHVKVTNKYQLTINLTEEMDKAIMNRPFYWQYMSTTGQQGEPLTLSLKTKNIETDTDDVELIHFGSIRLHTIFDQLRQSARFVRLVENVATQTNTMLFPWIRNNIIISYEEMQKKDELFSIDLQLVNGTIVRNMMEHLMKRPLSEQISNYCYTISPLIKLQSGFNRMK